MIGLPILAGLDGQTGRREGTRDGGSGWTGALGGEKVRPIKAPVSSR